MFKWILLLIISLAIFLYFAAYLIPKRFLRPFFALKESRDRGLKIIPEKNGSSIVYAPDYQYGKYVDQYVLSERDGDKIMLLSVAEDVKFIDFDVAVFNEKDKVVKVVNVRKTVEDGFVETALPDETAYVSLILNKVDNAVFKNDVMAKVPAGNVFLNILLTSFALVAEIFVTKWAISNLFGKAFREIFMLSSKSTAITSAIAAAAIVLNALITVLVVAVRNKNVNKRVA